MNLLSISNRPVRLFVGLLVLAVPVFSLLIPSVRPTIASPENFSPVGQANMGLLQITDTPTSTPTPTATATPTITPNFAATQTSVAQTQTSVPGTQTAIAATQTAQALPTGTTQFSDAYEPNNTLQTAYTVSIGSATSRITLWPNGDLDYFRFYAKAGTAYEVFTSNLQLDLDTYLRFYDTQGLELIANDDYLFGSRASKVSVQVPIDGYYYARVENKAPVDTVNKTYTLEVREVAAPATTTPFPTSTRVPSIDRCDTLGQNNFAFETACLLVADDPAETFDFVPVDKAIPDNDFFRMWVRQGFYYTCLTDNLGPFTDTNMIFYDQNRQGIAGNNDRAPEQGDLRSELTYFATYTGWLYVLVGPVYPPEYALSNRYTYSLSCTSSFVTPTPLPTFTPTPRPPGSGGGSGGGFFPTATFTPPASPTNAAITIVPPTAALPTPRPNVQVVPLPTSTPPTAAQQNISLNVTVYYDENLNYLPELTEGVMDVAVVVYDNGTGQLLAFGYTNEAGTIHFGPLAVNGAVRLEVPFLGYSQVVVSSDPDIRLRIAPTNLPGVIP